MTLFEEMYMTLSDYSYWKELEEEWEEDDRIWVEEYMKGE